MMSMVDAATSLTVEARETLNTRCYSGSDTYKAKITLCINGLLSNRQSYTQEQVGFVGTLHYYSFIFEYLVFNNDEQDHPAPW